MFVFGPSHMTKMLAMLINGKKLKNPFPDHLADCPEPWGIASWDLVLQMLSK